MSLTQMRLVNLVLLTATILAIAYSPKLAPIFAYGLGWYSHKIDETKKATEKAL